jgi:hypothetical protein
MKTSLRYTVSVGNFGKELSSACVTFMTTSNSCWTRFAPMAQHGTIRGIEQRFHRRPLPQKRFAHLVPQSGQDTELRLEGQHIFAVDIVRITGAADVLHRMRELFRLHVPGLDPVLFEQLALGKGFECPNQRLHGCLCIVGHAQFPPGMRQQVERE